VPPGATEKDRQTAAAQAPRGRAVFQHEGVDLVAPIGSRVLYAAAEALLGAQRPSNRPLWQLDPHAITRQDCAPV